MPAGYSGEFQDGIAGLLETIPKWGPEFYISIEVLFHSFTKATWCSVIHFTSSGYDEIKMGDRLPGVFTRNDAKLFVGTHIDTNPNEVGSFDIATETWYKIEMEQKKNHKGEVNKYQI